MNCVYCKDTGCAYCNPKKNEGYPDNNPKTALGLTKPQMSLTPSTALVHLALAFADGAAKYGAYNWREKKVSSTVYVDAMLRHIADWFDGENVAPDSGVHHLAHVMACCAIIIDAETVGNLNDNRPPKAPTAELIRAMTKGGLVSQADLDALEARLRKSDLAPIGDAILKSSNLDLAKAASHVLHRGTSATIPREVQWPLPVTLEDEGTPL